MNKLSGRRRIFQKITPISYLYSFHNISWLTSSRAPAIQESIRPKPNCATAFYRNMNLTAVVCRNMNPTAVVCRNMNSTTVVCGNMNRTAVVCRNFNSHAVVCRNMIAVSGRLHIFQKRQGQQYKIDLKSLKGSRQKGRMMTGPRAAAVANVFLVILQQMLGQIFPALSPYMVFLVTHYPSCLIFFCVCSYSLPCHSAAHPGQILPALSAYMICLGHILPFLLCLLLCVLLPLAWSFCSTCRVRSYLLHHPTHNMLNQMLFCLLYLPKS